MAALLGHTPDVEERQVLVDFEADAQFLWHHRLLLLPIDRAGRWVCASPTFEVQTIDLTEHRVIALARGQPVPAARRQDAFLFDPEVPAIELARMRAEAAQLRELLAPDLAWLL